MPLVLSLREGQDFFVDTKRFTVADVKSETEFSLQDDNGKRFKISDREATEVIDNVMISAGDAVPIARVSIDAPPEILVVRGNASRKAYEKFGKNHARKQHEPI